MKQSIFEIIKSKNKIDIVNNASIAVEGTLDKLDENDWDKVMDTNVKSYFYAQRKLSME